jgi:hypothetical protein
MKTCFFITPIGEAGSFDRKRSDTILSFLLENICKKYQIKVIRSDKINEATSLINSILKYLFFADIVVSDLSNNNPNVFYETAVRHCTGKPIIHMAQIGQSLPFDIKDFNTIFVDHTDGRNLKEAEKILEEMIKISISISDAEIYNPVTIGAKLNNLNITFSLFQSKDELLNEVKDILSKATDTLADIKPLIQDNPIKNVPRWTGKWISNIGFLDIVEKDNILYGKYQYYSKEYIGSLEGRIIDDFIVFKWKWRNKSLSGFGYWDISIKELEGNFKGGWFYDHESYSYESLIEAINKKEIIEIDEYRYWVIYGRV